MKGRRFIDSFRYAADGLIYAVKTQRNMKIHSVVAVIVILLSWHLKINYNEFLFIIFSIFLVLVAELVNTAIESTVDLFTSEYHPLAKIAKNIAAGAVLLTAVNALIVGCVIFSRYFF
jgi:diacylglycerol kinase (ATP)